MAATETYTMDMTVAVQGLVNLFLNMDVKSREMFIKLLVVKLEEQEVDLILEVVDMRNTTNKDFNDLNVKIEADHYSEAETNIKPAMDVVYSDIEAEIANSIKTEIDAFNEDIDSKEPMDIVASIKKEVYYDSSIQTDLVDVKIEAKDIKNEKDETSVFKKILFKCKLCNFTAKKNIDLLLHAQSAHKGCKDESEMFKCKECDFTSAKKYDLEKHVSYHHIKGKYNFVFACDHCDYKTKYKHALVNHVASVHEGIQYTCPKCVYKTKSKQSLMNHVVSC